MLKLWASKSKFPSTPLPNNNVILEDIRDQYLPGRTSLFDEANSKTSFLLTLSPEMGFRVWHTQTKDSDYQD